MFIATTRGVLLVEIKRNTLPAMDFLSAELPPEPQPSEEGAPAAACPSPAMNMVVHDKGRLVRYRVEFRPDEKFEVPLIEMKTAVPVPPNSLFERIEVKVSPGGRFLAMCYSDEPSIDLYRVREDLSIFKIFSENGHSIAWSACGTHFAVIGAVNTNNIVISNKLLKS